MSDKMTAPARARTGQLDHIAHTDPPKKLCILLSIDWGTFKFAAGFSICANGDTISVHEPSILSFNDIDCLVPMMATWYNKDLVHGFELRDLLRDGKVKSEDVIEFFKLALYDHGGQVPMSKRANRVKEQLAQLGKSTHELFTAHLKAVFEDCKWEIRRSGMRFHFKAEDLAQMPVKVRLSVPRMWSPSARRQMQEAAQAAGIPLVALASEPPSVLAYFVYKIANGSIDFGTQLKKAIRR
ncbi:hypothetical protein LTR85_006789 [Meristemomyces frigidus]|nr:hypothetical protein LTR85_006789 [Meristemomyces frigidus]